jgi:hypothetical protein
MRILIYFLILFLSIISLANKPSNDELLFKVDTKNRYGEQFTHIFKNQKKHTLDVVKKSLFLNL